MTLKFHGQDGHDTYALYPVTFFPQQCLYFFPLPHGHGSLRPVLSCFTMGAFFSGPPP